MATRTKTIRIPVNFGNVADIADNVKTSLGSKTIFTPENSVGNPVTFISVLFYYPWQNNINNADLISFTSFITLDGSSETSFTVTGTILDSGEEMSGVVGPIDFSTYFNNNFGTVTSKDISLSVTIDVSGSASRAVYCYFELTYQFDDSAQTQVQTICIPFENSGNLATTQTTVETLLQLTNSGGLLEGYSNLSPKYRWIQLKGNTNSNNASNDITLSYSFDSGGTSTLPIKEQGGAGDAFVEYQIDSSGLSSTSTHTFQLWSNVANRFSNIIINEWVTYTFTTSGTTQVVNYIEYPIAFTWPLETTSSNFSRYGREILISEPSNIIMENCAVEIIYNTNISATLQLRVGSQSFTSYAMLANQVTGCFGLQHRFDSGSSAGSGVTLNRGVNIINVDGYESAGDITNLSGTVKLLYRSGVSSLGVASHSRLAVKLNSNVNFTAVLSTSNEDSLSFLESNYWIHGVGYQAHYFAQSTGMFLSLKVGLLSGEYSGGGYLTAYSDWYLSDNEIAYTYWNICVCPFSKLYPQEPRNLIDITQTRTFLSSSTTANREGSRLFVSYNNITFTLSGNVTGSNGGEIQLNLYKQNTSNDYELHQTTTITGDSAYSFFIYNDLVNYQVVAYEDSTFKGTSIQGLYNDDFDINLASGSGGEYGYGFG